MPTDQPPEFRRAFWSVMGPLLGVSLGAGGFALPDGREWLGEEDAPGPSIEDLYKLDHALMLLLGPKYNRRINPETGAVQVCGPPMYRYNWALWHPTGPDWGACSQALTLTESAPGAWKALAELVDPGRARVAYAIVWWHLSCPPELRGPWLCVAIEKDRQDRKGGEG